MSDLSTREQLEATLMDIGCPIDAVMAAVDEYVSELLRVSVLEAESNTTRLQEMLDQQTEYSIRLQRKLESLGIEPWGDFRPSTSSVVGSPEQETKA